MHVSPLGGLTVHTLGRHLAVRPDSGLVLSRISFDTLGRLALDECEIRIQTPRPGRTIELIEAVALISGRPAVQTRAWLLASGDTTAVAGGAAGQITPPEALDPWPLTSVWPGGYIASLDPFASSVALVGTANGIAVRQSPTSSSHTLVPDTTA